MAEQKRGFNLPLGYQAFSTSSFVWPASWAYVSTSTNAMQSKDPCASRVKVWNRLEHVEKDAKETGTLLSKSLCLTWDSDSLCPPLPGAQPWLGTCLELPQPSLDIIGTRAVLFSCYAETGWTCEVLSGYRFCSSRALRVPVP